MANEPALPDAVIAPGTRNGAAVNSARTQLSSYATNRRQLRTAIETQNRRSVYAAGTAQPNRILPRAGINQVEQESGRSFRDSQGLLHLNFVALAARAAEDRATR
jgi:hypothetical protein